MPKRYWIASFTPHIGLNFRATPGENPLVVAPPLPAAPLINMLSTSGKQPESELTSDANGRPHPMGRGCRRPREVLAMVEAQVAGLMEMPVGFMNMCTPKRASKSLPYISIPLPAWRGEVNGYVMTTQLASHHAETPKLIRKIILL